MIKPGNDSLLTLTSELNVHLRIGRSAMSVLREEDIETVTQ